MAVITDEERGAQARALGERLLDQVKPGIDQVAVMIALAGVTAAFIMAAEKPELAHAQFNAAVDAIVSGLAEAPTA